MTDVFISYSRKDKQFVQALHTALNNLNRSVWVDWQDILPTEEWWQAIEAGIETANSFIIVLSPDSTTSAICQQEVEHALKHNKRLVPIVHREVEAKAVHPALGARNWIFMREADEFNDAFKILIKALDTDLEYVRVHTRLLLRAVEWEREGQDSSFLLRGSDLEDSEQWLKHGKTREPKPTELQIQYISASRQLPHLRPKLRTVLLVSVAVTSLLMTVRLLGGLQPLELAAYDQLMRLRPSEGQDNRLLIVEVTEEDIQAQNREGDRGGGTLSDRSLSRLLQKLEQSQPRLIGLDLYRDFQAQSPELASRLRADKRLITVCKLSETDAQGKLVKPGVKPPFEISPDSVPERVGFSDLVADEAQIVRRQLLVHAPDREFCTTENSFGLILARRYLEMAGKTYKSPVTPTGSYVQDLQLGDTIFKPLEIITSGYAAVDAWAYQVLLKYRTDQGDPGRIARRVSLGRVLTNQVSAQEIQDRIVLIGVTSRESVNDYWGTPYGELPGVVVQAQMVSQLLSAVLNGRPLLWWWPLWGDWLWVWGWSLVGGVIIWYFRRYLFLGLAGGVAIISLCGLCYFVFTIQSGWIPLVPSILALLGTEGCALYLTLQLRQ